MKTARGLWLALLGMSSSCTCQPQVGAAVQGEVSGRVVKGPVSAAAVTAYELQESGRRGDSVGTAQAAEDGTFNVTIGGHKGPTLVCATGGTYIEEATGGLVQMGPTELCAIVIDQKLGRATKDVLITPFTSWQAALVGCLLGKDNASDLAGKTALAHDLLNDFLAAGQDGFDFQTTVPFDVTAGTAPSLTPDVWHGILLAGLSETARQIALASGLDPGVRVTAATLTSELQRDIDDGTCIFDGQGASSRLSQGTLQLSSTTLRGAPQGLATGILRFLEGERNLSGVSPASVDDFVRALTTHESAIFGPIDGTSDGDLDPPDIVFNAPLPGTISGVVPVDVTVTDASAITSCAFTEPASLVATSATFTDGTHHECHLAGTLNTGSFPDGPVTVTVAAIDAGNNPATKDLALTVNNSVPTISISSPTDGQVVSGTVTVQATADDADGILSLSVTGAGTLLDAQPAPAVFEAQWDTTLFPEGELTLTFRAVDNTNNSFERTVTVTVDNLAVGTIAGRVDLGAPVTGATVNALEFTGMVRGNIIGSATSNAAGQYQVENPSNFTGPVLLVATGGSYVDIATGLTIDLKAGQELTVALALVAPGDAKTVNLNAWTTLATRRAVVRKDESPSEAQALSFNANLFAKHLRRPTTVPITTIASADLFTEAPAASSDQAVLALSHAGLSRYAANVSVQTNQQVGAITLNDLLDVLVADLSDGLLDGSDSGVPLFLDQGSQVAADSYITRRSLASSMNNFAENLAITGVTQPRNNSNINGTPLSVPGALFDDVALDADGNLYPPEQPPLPFDQTAPEIVLAFAPPNNLVPFGASLTGVVTITGRATDASSRLAAFALLDPSDLTDSLSTIDDLQVQIGTDRPPNVAETAAACGLTLGDPPLFGTTDAAHQVCVCTEAADEVDNVAHGLWCFTRPEPAVSFFAPSPAEGASVVGAATVSAAATPGFDIASFAFLDGFADAPELPTDNLLTLSTTIPTSFVDAVHQPDVVVSVQATDIAGRAVTASRTFTRPVPAVVVAIPAPNQALAKASFPVTFDASATSGYDLTACDFAVKQGATTILSGPATLDSSTSCRALPQIAEAQLPDGSFTFELAATDLVGRVGSTSAAFVKDATPPTVAVTQPAAGVHIGSATLVIQGTVTDASGVTGVQVSLTGASSASRSAVVTGSTWAVTFLANEVVTNGLINYIATATDLHGNAAATASRSVTIDRVAPTVTVPVQPGYRNETTSSSFSVTGTVAANTLTFTPNAAPSVPAWTTSTTTTPPASPTPPTLGRWLTRVDDAASAPTFQVNLTDAGTTNAANFVVKYAVGATCPIQSQATNTATRSGSTFTASITDATTTVNLAAQTGAATLCLAMFAIDEAANVAPMNAFFKWNTIVPPISLADDSNLYDRSANNIDMGFYTNNVEAVFHPNNTSAFGSAGFVVKHAVLYNPNAISIDVSLSLSGTTAMKFNAVEDMYLSDVVASKYWANTTITLANPTNVDATNGSTLGTNNLAPRYSTACTSASTTSAAIINAPKVTDTTKASATSPQQSVTCVSAANNNTKYLQSPVRSGTSFTDAVVDSRLNQSPSGFASLTRTMEVYRLNDNGTLGTAIAVTGGFATLPTRTKAVVVWRVKHTVPAGTLLLGKGVDPTTLEATCPLISDTVGGTTSIPDFANNIVFRDFLGDKGCHTVVNANDGNRSCQLGGSGQCHIDKAVWSLTLLTATQSAGSNLSRSNRAGGITTPYLTLDLSGDSRFLP